MDDGGFGVAGRGLGLGGQRCQHFLLCLTAALCHPFFDRRKVTISSFKGKVFVDIREWYEKEGVLAPGQKGLSLAPEQWAKLREALPALAAALATE